MRSYVKSSIKMIRRMKTSANLLDTPFYVVDSVTIVSDDLLERFTDGDLVDESRDVSFISALDVVSLTRREFCVSSCERKPILKYIPHHT